MIDQQSQWAQWLQKLSPTARTQQEYLARRGNKREEPAWHVLFVNDTEPQPQFRRFASFELMRRFLVEQRQTSPDTFAVPVYGLPARYNRAQTATDRRYLIHPNGKIVPLFDAIEEIEVDNSFMLGDMDLDITPVTTATLTNPGSRPRGQQAQSRLLEEDDIDEEEDPELGDIPML